MFNKLLIATIAAIALSACTSMTSPRYSMSADNNVTLRKIEGASVAVVQQIDNSKLDAGCRMVGPIAPTDNRTISQFIADSFNDEFKFAQIHGGTSPKAPLVMTLDKAAFSSTSGWWDLSVTLRHQQNGSSVTASSRYDFKTAFDGAVACNNSALALTPAVQDLIQKIVTQRAFRRMVTPGGQEQ